MTKFLKAIAMLLVAVVAILVNASGYCVFWNEVILNIWQLFETVEITDILKLPYEAFVVLAVGLCIFNRRKSPDVEKSDEQALADAIGAITTKCFYILLTLLTTMIVF